MNCQWFTDHLDEYDLGGLRQDEQRLADAHLASCGACRRRLAAARAADAACRAALRWAEPSAEFAPRVLALARRQVRRRRLAIMATAAAAVALLGLAMLLRDRKPPVREIAKSPKVTVPVEPAAPAEKVLAGALYDAYGLPAARLVRGRLYQAAAPTALAVGNKSTLLLAGGTEFASAPRMRDGAVALSVLAGEMLGQVPHGAHELALELAPELGGAVVRTSGCEFYSAGFPADRLAAGMAFPAGSLATWPESIRVHVLTGTLEIDLGTQKLALRSGDSAIIAGGTSAGSTRALSERVRELQTALGPALLARQARYAGLVDDYADRLLELRSARAGRSLPQVEERIALVEDLLFEHSATLSDIEAQNPAFAELEAAGAELRHHEQLRAEADEALGHLIALGGPAR